MKFSIDYSKRRKDRTLTYDVNELGFNMEPKVKEISFGLVLNYLDLTIKDDKRVIEVSGFSGYGLWVKSNYDVPNYKEGALIIQGEFKTGVGSYRINEKELPVYVNIQTGWICIGDPQKTGKTVEFITNCVMVIDDNNEFTSLWLKPQSLPKLT